VKGEEDKLIKFMNWILNQDSFLYTDISENDMHVEKASIKYCFWNYSTFITEETDIKNSLMFNCMFQNYTTEVKNLIWLEYYRLALFMSEPNTYAYVKGNDNCVKRTLTYISM
jgi:hypothetical protein